MQFTPMPQRTKMTRRNFGETARIEVCLDEVAETFLVRAVPFGITSIVEPTRQPSIMPMHVGIVMPRLARRKILGLDVLTG